MGKLYVVATPIGNLSDLSPRALETLSNADLIAAEDTRRTLPLLTHFDIHTPLVSYHKFNENERSTQLIDRIRDEDLTVALVSDAGTPCISDPGCVLVEQARQAGVEVTVIPGPSAVISALSVCGFVFRQFSFLGFIPRTNREKKAFFHTLCTSSIRTNVLYEAATRIKASLKEIEKLLPDCRVFVINDITKFYEKCWYGDIATVIAQIEADKNAALGEYTFIVQRNEPEPEEEPQPEGQPSAGLSPEALLVEEMVKTGCTLKQAIAALSERGAASKNEAYKASLHLKEIVR